MFHNGFNLENFPGFIASDTHAHGIYNFEQSGFYKDVIRRNLAPENVIEKVKNQHAALEEKNNKLKENLDRICQMK